MNYSKSLLLYQDEPKYGFFLKLIVMIIPVASLVGSIILLLSGDSTGAIALLVEAFFVGLIFWCVFPRKYQVCEDHLRIVLGGLFSIKVGFDQIKTIEVAHGSTLTMNFITKFTRNYVAINKKKGFSITITPKDNEFFIENANEALSQWVKASLNNP